LGVDIKADEMDEEGGFYGGENKSVQGFGGGNLKERDHLENLFLNGRIILKLNGKALAVFMWFRIGTSGQLC
jgi:hypothetical protein